MRGACVLTLCIVLGVLAVPWRSETRAATLHVKPDQAVARLIGEQRLRLLERSRNGGAVEEAPADLAKLSGRLRGRTVRPLGRAFSPARVSYSDLALPDSVIAAGNGHQGWISSGQGPFVNYHHTWNGFQSGIAADFDFQPIMTLWYQGSIFADLASARNYMLDSTNLTESWSTTTPTDCFSSLNVPCEITAFKTTTGQLAVYTAALVNYCVIEAMYQGDPGLIAAHSDDVAKADADTIVLGVQEAKKACVGSSPNTAPLPQPTAVPQATPVSHPPAQPTPVPQPTAGPQPWIRIAQVVLTHQTKGKAATTRVLKSQEKGDFLAVYNAGNAGSLTPTGSVTFTQVGRSMGSLTLRTRVLSDGTPVLDAVKAFKVGTKTLHLTAWFNVSIGPSKDVGYLEFAVQPKKKR